MNNKFILFLFFCAIFIYVNGFSNQLKDDAIVQVNLTIMRHNDTRFADDVTRGYGIAFVYDPEASGTVSYEIPIEIDLKTNSKCILGYKWLDFYNLDDRLYAYLKSSFEEEGENKYENRKIGRGFEGHLINGNIGRKESLYSVDGVGEHKLVIMVGFQPYDLVDDSGRWLWWLNEVQSPVYHSLLLTVSMDEPGK